MRTDQLGMAYYDGNSVTVARDDGDDSEVFTAVRNRNQAIQALFDASWYAVIDADWQAAPEGEQRIRISRFC